MTVGALIRVMVWAVGLAVLAEVVPEEIKLPNCSPILALLEITACWDASTTGMVVELFCVIVSPSVPPLMAKLRTLAEPVCWVLAINSWPLLSTSTSRPPWALRITLLT